MVVAKGGGVGCDGSYDLGWVWRWLKGGVVMTKVWVGCDGS